MIAVIAVKLGRACSLQGLGGACGYGLGLVSMVCGYVPVIARVSPDDKLCFVFHERSRIG